MLETEKNDPNLPYTVVQKVHKLEGINVEKLYRNKYYFMTLFD